MLKIKAQNITQLFSYFRSYRFRSPIKDHNCLRSKAQVLEILADLAQSVFILSFQQNATFLLSSPRPQSSLTLNCKILKSEIKCYVSDTLLGIKNTLVNTCHLSSVIYIRAYIPILKEIPNKPFQVKKHCIII